MTDTEPPAVERVHPPDWLVRYLVNPVMRRVLRKRRGKLSDSVLLLRFSGRRSGKAYEIPVGYRMIDGRMALLSNTGWRYNFQGGADVEIVVAGETERARATLLGDPDEVAAIYARLIDEVGLGAANRLGIKVHVDRKPTHDELVGMIERSGLSVVWLDA
ncbi:MAG: nitroreductase family deazaflavin-dependent oxidoreductase [Actinobacteria bacterium]|nr:nitroreductase family deazaflavin-dependent oxidoreductase [Actinomycetota bacterium]